MGKINYEQYKYNRMDAAEYAAKVFGITGVISYLFYDSPKAMVMIPVIGYVQYTNMKKQKLKNRSTQLSLQFKALMETLVTSLTAGYSLERAFQDAGKDLMLVYPPESDIFSELEGIVSGIQRNIPVEDLLRDFGLRSKVEDIENFANVIRAAKKTGGNMIAIMKKTVRNITEKMMVEEEIQTMIAQKKLEQKIMMLMPYGILAYLRLTNGDFLTVLYHNSFGAIIMTIFLAGIYGAGKWAERIMDIQI